MSAAALASDPSVSLDLRRTPWCPKYFEGVHKSFYAYSKDILGDGAAQTQNVVAASKVRRARRLGSYTSRLTIGPLATMTEDAGWPR